MRYLRLLVLAVCGTLALPMSVAAVGPGKTLTWAGGGKGRVLFEGSEHAEKGYTCKDCHPGLFSMKKGSAAITMAALDAGRFCGACHNGAIAFSTKDAKKCHECHKGEKNKKEHGERKKHEHEHDDD